MSKLEIMLNKEVFKPGEKVDGSLVLELTKNIKVKDAIVAIYGNEHTHITRTRSCGKHTQTVTYTEDAEIIDESQKLISQFDKTYQLDPYSKGKKTVLPTGQHVFKFSFQLPDDATPAYDGEHAEVNYEISAKIDTPWWFDLKGEKKFYVIPGDKQVQEMTKKLIQKKSSNSLLPQMLSPDVDLKVELENAELKREEYIKGKVIVINKSGKEIRNILLELYANEHAKAEGYTEDSEVMAQSLKIPVNQPELNYFEQSFKFLIPKDATPTLEGTYFSIDWYFRVGLDIAKAKDLEIETPIILL